MTTEKINCIFGNPIDQVTRPHPAEFKIVEFSGGLFTGDAWGYCADHATDVFNQMLDNNDCSIYKVRKL